MQSPPDLIVLSAELAGMGGIEMPIEVRSVQSMGALSDAEDQRLSVTGVVKRSLADLMSRSRSFLVQ